MTPSLPNILPSGNADSFQDRGTSAYSGQAGQSFDHVMAGALDTSASRNDPNDPSASNSSSTDDNANSPSQSDTSNDTRKSDANHHKKVTSHSTAQASSTEVPGTHVTPDHLGNVSPAPIPVFLQSNAPVAPGTLLSGQPLGTMTTAAEAKAVSLETPQPPGPTVVNAQAGSKSKSADKTGVSLVQKPIEALAAANPTESSPKTANPATPILPVQPVVQNDSATADVSDKTATENPASSSLLSSVNFESKKTDPAPGDSDGTPAAQRSVLMQSTEKTNKIASLPGKNLPGSTTPVARENNFPLRADSTNVSSNFSPQNGSVSDATSVSASDDTQAVATSSSPALERTHELVALHALRLTSTGTNSLQVVIKPDTGTQLSLELRQRGNGIEAEATLQQGDFTHLNQHWNQLQQQLEQRGIRLAPLGNENNFADTSGGTFQSKQNHTSPETETAGSFAGPVLAALPGVSNLQPPVAHRGWETWA